MKKPTYKELVTINNALGERVYALEDVASSYSSEIDRLREQPKALIHNLPSDCLSVGDVITSIDGSKMGMIIKEKKNHYVLFDRDGKTKIDKTDSYVRWVLPCGQQK